MFSKKNYCDCILYNVIFTFEIEDTGVEIQKEFNALFTFSGV